MMLNADLPESFRGSMVAQFEADGGLKLLKLARTKLDEEPVPLVRDFDDLGPGKPVDAESIAVNKNSWNKMAYSG